MACKLPFLNAFRFLSTNFLWSLNTDVRRQGTILVFQVELIKTIFEKAQVHRTIQVSVYVETETGRWAVPNVKALSSSKDPSFRVQSFLHHNKVLFVFLLSSFINICQTLGYFFWHFYLWIQTCGLARNLAHLWWLYEIKLIMKQKEMETRINLDQKPQALMLL